MMRLLPGLLILLLSSFVLATPASAVVLGQAPVLRTLLAADFDDKPVGQPIGIGGAAAGEPDSLSNLDTEVISLGGGNRALRVSNDLSSTTARRVRFSLQDEQEVTESILVLSFLFRASALDRYSILVREAGGSAQNFFGLSFSTAGLMSLTTAAENPVPLADSSYAADTDYRFQIVFNLDDNTYSLIRNGQMLVANRSHGIESRGVGRLLIGYQSSSAGNAFVIDEVRARRLVDESAFIPVLDAGFDELALGQALAAGGPDLGEPVAIDPGLVTEIVALSEGGRGVQVSAAPQPFTQVMRFGLLDALEIDRGLVVVDIDFRTDMLDHYLLRLRESGSSTRDFLSLRLDASGAISASDAAGFLGNVGTYAAGERHRFRMVLDMDRREADLAMDGLFLRQLRRHGLNDRGVGGVIAGLFDFPLSGGPFVLGSVRVKAERALDIPTALAFVQQPSDAASGLPLQPAVEVAVVNLENDPVGEAVPVQLSILSGPAGASLQGGEAITVDGVASFPDLRLDLPGTYTLRASALALQANSSAFDVTAAPDLPDAIFASGFE